MSLQPVLFDWNDILIELKGNDLRGLLDKTRTEVELFYSKGAVGDVIAAINRKADEKQNSVKVLQSIDLSKKSDDELVELLKHREELMRFRALEVVHAKVTGKVRTTKQAQQDMIDKLRLLPKAAVRILNTKDMATLRMALVLIIAITDDEFKHSFRKAGGLRPVAKLLALPDLLDDKEFVIHLLVVIIQLVTIDENREQWRTVNGLTRLIPFISHKDHKIALMSTESLLNLSFNENNQPVIIAAHSLEQIFKNSRNEDYQMQYESLFLIRNLARCQIGKEKLAEDHYRRLLPLLDPVKAYSPDIHSVEHKNTVQLQRVVLETLYECAQLEKNQKILGQLGIIRTLQAFFLPMRTGSNAVWNFEILLRVLKIIDNVIKLPTNRDLFIELKGIALIAAILQNAQTYPEDCVLEAASVLTTVATKATMNQQAYGKMGMQILINLLKQFPNREFVHDLVAQMIANVSANQGNRVMVVAEGGDKVLMMFIRESRVKQVLVNSCAGLAHLCTEQKVVRTVVQAKTVPHLVGLLQLNQPELQTNVARVLALVAEASEAGLVEIVKNGGVVPLVALLHEKSVEVKEQALLTFGKLLFAPGKAGPENISYFFQAEGEKPLMDAVLAEQEEIQVPALSIVQGLTSTAENREFLRDAQLEAKLVELERHPNVKKAGSQVANLLRLIQVNLKKDAVNARLNRNAAAMQAKEVIAGARRPALWLKVMYEYHCKIIPVRDGLSYSELQDIVRQEFGIKEWERMSLALGSDEIDISDQRSLDFIMDLLSKEKGDPVIVVSPADSAIKGAGSAGANKLDVLLQKLTHRQLRSLLKQAIDQGADLAKPIKEYITINKETKNQYKEERVGGDARGSGQGGSFDPVGTKGGATLPGGRALPTLPPGGGGPQLSNAGGPQGALPAKATPPPPPPGAPPAPAPPPPPSLAAPSGKLNIVKSVGAVKAGGMDLMSQLKDVVGTKDSFLRKTETTDAEKVKRGDVDEVDGELKAKVLQKTLLYEETTMGSEMWRTDMRGYVNEIQRVCLQDYEIAHIAFEIVDLNEIEFGEALKMLISTRMSAEDLARHMLDLGFTVMNANYSREDTYEVIKEYSRIMCPYDLPMSVLVKALRQIVRGNGRNRRDGALNGDLETLATEHRKKYAVHDQSQDVVQGYWSKGGGAGAASAPASKGGLFGALDALAASDPEPEETFTLDDLTGGSSLFAALDEYEAKKGGS